MAPQRTTHYVYNPLLTHVETLHDSTYREAKEVARKYTFSPKSTTSYAVSVNNPEDAFG